MKTSRRLIIGIDISENGDMASLMVGEQDGNVVHIVNSLIGDDAIELYEKLTTVQDKSKVILANAMIG